MSNDLQWKILRDYFYADIYLQHGFGFIESAGFFYDTEKVNRNIQDSLDLLCTPLSFQLPTTEKSCVLLTTGSFCPVHQGHLDMMESARHILEENGWHVLAGYISPSHDEYIDRKCGHLSIDIDKRMQLIQDAIEQCDWLMLDPWEAVFNSVAVNFTDVIQRLKSYIERHSTKSVKVFYVCGADNARFVKTFLFKGHCVVVDRPGHRMEFNEYKHYASDRILFAEGSVDISSSQLRQAQTLNKVQLKLDLITQGHLLENKFAKLCEGYYSGINFHRSESVYLGSVSLNKMASISLDETLIANYSLSLSRLYDLGGARFIAFTARPGYSVLDEQLKQIPSGEYALFDFDSYSGKTLAFVKNLLASHNINIVATRTLLERQQNEILDAADFFLDGANAGLVVRLPDDTITRAPYIYPYVNPAVRCSVSNALQFSIDVWKMNRDYFVNRDDKLSGLMGNKALFLYLGFSESTSLAEIADWHYQKLLQFLPNQ